MVKVHFADNVFLDSASTYSWDDLNESVFLENLFMALKSEMGELFGECSFYIFSTHGIGEIPKSANLAQKNKVLVYISDESSSIPRHLETDYLAIFKSYTPYEVKNSNIFAFNLGYVSHVPRFDSIPINDRSIDIFFSGNLNTNRYSLYRALHPVLRHLPKALQRVWFFSLRKARLAKLIRQDFSEQSPELNNHITFTDGFRAGLTQEKYGQLLADSKIVLCPRGFSSPETFRHIEALRAGAVVLTEKLPDTHFYRGAPFVVVENWGEGLGKARELLSDPNRLSQLQEECVSWYEFVCSEQATARYMHKKLRELPDWQ